MGRLARILLGTEPRAVRSETPVEPSGMLPGVLPPSRSAAASVTLDSALTLSTVYRSVSIFATAAAQLTLGEQRGGLWIEPSSFTLAPDPELPCRRLIKRLVIGLCGTGNAYLRRFRNPDKSTAAVRALNPLGVSIRYSDAGAKLYDYADLYGSGPRLGTQTFTADQVIHLRLLEVPGHVYGLGPIQAAQAGLAGGIDLRDYATNWFGDSGIPTGTLSTEQTLTPDLATAYKDRWHANLAEKRGVAVLGNGLKYDPVLIRPADAQWLESQQFSVTDIARLLGMPAPLVLAAVEGSSMTYQTLETAEMQLQRYGLMQYLLEIEDALSSCLPRGRVCRFMLNDSLRPDARTRADVAAVYVKNKIKLPNEVRAEEGLPPIAGGDEFPTIPQESTSADSAPVAQPR